MKSFIISIIIIMIALILAVWIKADLTTISESFISMVIGLMGICATIIVGFQIFNSIDMNQRMKEQNSLYSKRFDELTARQRELESLISQTKQELTIAKSNNEKEFSSLQSYVRIAQAIAISERQPFSAFYSWYNAMRYAIKADNSNTINLIIDNLEILYRYIKTFDQQKLNDYINHDNPKNVEDIKRINIANLPTSDDYKNIQDKFEYIVSEIIQLVKKNHNTLV